MKFKYATKSQQVSRIWRVQLCERIKPIKPIYYQILMIQSDSLYTHSYWCNHQIQGGIYTPLEYQPPVWLLAFGLEVLRELGAQGAHAHLLVPVPL